MHLRKLSLAAAGVGLFLSGTATATFFSDITSTHWAYNAVQWISDSGIMTGPGTMPGKFDPAGTVNRAQLAAVLWRYDRVMSQRINDLQVRVSLLEGGGNSRSSSRSSETSSSRVADRFFSAMLTGGQETPPVTTNAGGQGFFTLEGDGDLRYDISATGLSSAITGAHFHIAAPGEAGPVIAPISLTGNRATGTVRGLTDAYVDDLLAGRMYVNIHTSEYPNGEIRGQMLLQTGSSSPRSSRGSSMSLSRSSFSSSSMSSGSSTSASSMSSSQSS